MEGDCMISKYSSQTFWTKLIEKNRTFKAKIFLNEPITDKTVYVHSIIFNRKKGIENVWAPIPDIKMLIGYLRYCFLPEAYRAWYEGVEGEPLGQGIMTLEDIVKKMSKNKAKYKYELENIKIQQEKMNKLWDFNASKKPRELNRFCREFNKTWTGDSNKFLFLKVFCTVDDLKDFILYTESVLSYDNMEHMIGYTEEELEQICEDAQHDVEKGEILKKVLIEGLSDVV